MMKTEKLDLTKEWDKTYPRDERVGHCKVSFVNRYGITLAADMFTPKNAEDKLPAIAVAGPFGAVKEQVSGRYAQEMAARGFLTICFDPSFTGESGGFPRNVAVDQSRLGEVIKQKGSSRIFVGKRRTRLLRGLLTARRRRIIVARLPTAAISPGGSGIASALRQRSPPETRDAMRFR